MTKGPILFDLDETDAAPGPDAAPPVPDPEMPEAPEALAALAAHRVLSHTRLGPIILATLDPIQ